MAVINERQYKEGTTVLGIIVVIAIAGLATGGIFFHNKVKQLDKIIARQSVPPSKMDNGN